MAMAFIFHQCAADSLIKTIHPFIKMVYRISKMVYRIGKIASANEK
jgi:hypothetical protein